MKQESIKRQTKSAIVSACFSCAIRLAVLYFLMGNIESVKSHTIIYIVTIVFYVAMVLQILFLPYLTWVRIKEIKKGEIYEASKY